MNYAHLFGPVRSRRLGRSLGVDMIPFKTCNCNCVYCECGGACAVDSEQREYVPAAELTDELDHFLGGNPEVDYVTFAGSGEPTLNTALGPVIRFVKEHFPSLKTALLTNGTLLRLPEVRDAILTCDLVLPSLDAVSDAVFRRVNRPHPGCDIRRMIDGLRAFSREYKGQLWVEVFIVPGINDTPEELSRIREALREIAPARVQLNSLDRPGACAWVTPATPERMAAIADALKPLPIEIISRKALPDGAALPHPVNLDGTILHQLQRRPATVEEIAVMCGATINEITATLDTLAAQGRLAAATIDGRRFYSVRA
ncbi:MAG: radical SAM protein [Chitinispirillaceae bacterium]|nr:radical SAM protein [Chitinispirillaceae bacterium]